MGAIVGKNEVDRIDLGDGEWVDIRRRFSYGLLNQLYTAKSEGERLALAITACSFHTDSGYVSAITPELLDALEITVFTRIAEEVVKRVHLGRLNPSTPISGPGSKEPVKV